MYPDDVPSKAIFACTEPYWCPIKHENKVLESHIFMENKVDNLQEQADCENLVSMYQMAATAKNLYQQHV